VATDFGRSKSHESPLPPASNGQWSYGDFAALGQRAHNFGVTNPNGPDPPSTLQAAVEQFSAFLASQGYPGAICWLSPTELLVDARRHYWIKPGRSQTTMRAEQRYAEGLERNLGIELRAICTTETQTFAYVFVPQDDLDRQYHLMGRALKLSCPVEQRPASIIGNRLRWLTLRLLNRESERVLRLFQ
jgi:hypothetical protein